MDLIVHTDGGSRGNPGKGGIGVVIEKSVNGQHETVEEFGKTIGTVTNNEAEYLAVIEALVTIKNYTFSVTGVHFFMDSKLVREQVSGNWKIKQDHLKKLCQKVKLLEIELGVPVSYTHVLRGHNQRADKLLNEALDAA